MVVFSQGDKKARKRIGAEDEYKSVIMINQRFKLSKDRKASTG